MHRRLKPKVHSFTYRIFMFWFDLDELESIERSIPIFSNEAPNLYSLRVEDHFRFRGETLRENVIAWVRNSGDEREIGNVSMLTLPRFCGYTFNPITIYVLRDPAGEPMISVVEVGNTFREFKPYLIPKVDDGFHARVVKNYYVSPFSDLDLSFDFRFAVPGDQLRVWIDDYRNDTKELVSVLSGERLELTTSNLIHCTLKYPFITLKVIGLIHWEALRLWWKKVPHRQKEADPELQQDVFNPHESLNGEVPPR